jgi:hypothetical protein
MKKRILSFVICAMFSGHAIDSGAQANNSLSNLTSPTAINVDLLPDKDNTRNLGSVNQSWKDLYFSGDQYLQGNRFISDAGNSANTFVGSLSGYSNNIGSSNSFFGERAGYANVSGNYNSLFGFETGTSTTGNLNSFFGSKAGLNNSSSANSFFGESAGFHTTTGEKNSFFGEAAGFFNSGGNNNSAFGESAGSNVTSGSKNTFIGFNADYYSQGIVNNATAIGNGATITSNNSVRIGNSSVTSIGGYSKWKVISDGRVKKNIKQNVPGLAFINKLQPITYNLDLDATDKIIARPPVKDKDGKIIQPTQTELNARKAKEQIVYTGFIAQDVEKAAKSLNYDFSGVDAAKNDHDLYGLRYADFVVPIVKAIQELSAQDDESKKQNENLQKQIDELKALMIAKSQNSSSTQASANIALTSASIEQNIPNPFDHTTIINYTLPQSRNGGTSAQIVITDNSGKTLKQINISGVGKGSVSVDASTLAQGAYNYSLIVDGKLIATKQMISGK